MSVRAVRKVFVSLMWIFICYAMLSGEKVDEWDKSPVPLSQEEEKAQLSAANQQLGFIKRKALD